MLIEQTLEKLQAMKLSALAEAVQQQLHSDDAATLSFEDRRGLLVDSEWTAREQRKLQRRLQTAKLRYPASLEAIDFTQPRRLNRQQVLTLGGCAWLAERHNLLITGPAHVWLWICAKVCGGTFKHGPGDDIDDCPYQE